MTFINLTVLCCWNNSKSHDLQTPLILKGKVPIAYFNSEVKLLLICIVKPCDWKQNWWAKQDLKGPTILGSSFSKELWPHICRWPELATPPEAEHFKYLGAFRAVGGRENSKLPRVAQLGIYHGNHRSGRASLICVKAAETEAGGWIISPWNKARAWCWTGVSDARGCYQEMGILNWVWVLPA